jgi:hypothetical protein
MLLAKPVGALDHEANDLVRRVNHAEPIRRLLIINLVEILVDYLEKGLFFVVRGNQRGGGAYGRVIRLQAFQRVFLGRSGEKPGFKSVKRLGDIVLAMEIAFIKNLGSLPSKCAGSAFPAHRLR